MAEIINLRAARKAKKRSTEAGQADANRAKFGLSKTEKARQRTDKSRADHLLDGAKLERE